MKLTDVKIRTLKPRESKYDVIEGDGFGVRIMPTGTISFQYVYKVRGRRRRMTLGRYPSMSLKEARAKYADEHAARLRGADPAEDRKRERIEVAKRGTLAELCDRYIERYAKPNKRTWANDEQLLREVRDTLGDMPVGDVTETDLLLVLEQIAERAPVKANRTLEVVRKMLKWARVRPNPAIEIEPLAKETKRDRVLDPGEIAAFWHALNDARADPRLVAAVRFMLASGQRKSEVLNAHWREIRGDWWTIPKERAKNEAAHRVPITRTMRELMGDGTGYVFPSPRSGEPVDARAPNRVLARMKARGTLVLDHFTLHDLRRTVGTNLGELKVPRLHIAKVLNHADSTVTATYDRHVYDDEKRAALGKWDRKLRGLIRGAVVKVVEA